MGNQHGFVINYYHVAKMNIVNESQLVVYYIDGSKVIYECESEDKARKEIDKLIKFSERCYIGDS
jgi:hypothetical protein